MSKKSAFAEQFLNIGEAILHGERVDISEELLSGNANQWVSNSGKGAQYVKSLKRQELNSLSLVVVGQRHDTSLALLRVVNGGLSFCDHAVVYISTGYQQAPGTR